MGDLINITGQILDSQIPDPIARDTETESAISAHEMKADPHLQYTTQARGDARYARYYNSFEEVLLPPFNLAANTWQELGSARVVGQQGAGTTWLVNVYFQYVPDGTTPQPYYQYCGAGILGIVFWQADLLINQGIEIPMEAHNEADFTARIRFGRGQSRKLEISPSRAINITAPGFGKISGLRLQ
jgi:hypothetical protein